MLPVPAAIAIWAKVLIIYLYSQTQINYIPGKILLLYWGESKIVMQPDFLNSYSYKYGYKRYH